MTLKFNISLICLLLFIGEVSAQIIDTVCAGDMLVIYSVDQHQGSSYQWNVAGGMIRSGNGTATIIIDWYNQPGLYRISVLEKNALNCPSDPVSAFVIVKGKNFKVTYPPLACLNDSITITGYGGDKYLWSNGNTNNTLKIKLISDTSLVLGISNLTCSLLIDSFPVTIKAVKNPVAAFSPDIDIFYKDQSVGFKYLGSSQDNVIWKLQKSTNNHLVSKSINVTFIDTGEASIKLITMNSIGCKDSITKMINIKDEQLYIPNAFTPNGDKLNDEFKPVGHGIRTYHLTVFNRWGEEIFQSLSMQEGWNGSYKGDALASDAYGYVIEATGQSGKTYYYNGTITLLR